MALSNAQKIWLTFIDTGYLTKENKKIFCSEWKNLKTFAITLKPEMLKIFHEFLLILKEEDSNPHLELIIKLELAEDILELTEETATDLVEICKKISPRKFKLKYDNEDKIRPILNAEVLKILNEIFLNENLISLDLSHYLLSSHILALEISKKLEELYLSGCSLRYKDTKMIIELLQGLPNLKKLDLSNNSTMSDEIHLIFEALSESNKKIGEFNISQNQITDKTLSRIMSILLKGTNFNLLKRLDLSGYEETSKRNVNTVTSDQKMIITNMLAKYPFQMRTKIIVQAEVDYNGKRYRETEIELVSYPVSNFLMFKKNTDIELIFTESKIKNKLNSVTL